MKLLITGAGGQVGSELIEVATSGKHDVYGYSSKELDITDDEQVQKIVAAVAPDVIINAAAYTAVDKAEEEKDLAYAVNATGVENLARACKKNNIPLLHISTDYVFDGEKTSPYLETDPTSPTGVYGASKLEGDKLLQSVWDKHIILRVSWVFGKQGSNFIKTMLCLGKDRNELSVVNDQFGAPTSARSIALCLLDMVDEPRFGNDDFPWGVYHFQSDPGVTWYEFAREIFHQAYELKLLDKQVKINPIPSSEFPTPVKRPKNSKLDGSLLQKLLAIKTADWKTDMIEMLKCL
jgi:dTDP-4-dehydrorhamnose reductase